MSTDETQSEALSHDQAADMAAPSPHEAPSILTDITEADTLSEEAWERSQSDQWHKWWRKRLRLLMCMWVGSILLLVFAQLYGSLRLTEPRKELSSLQNMKQKMSVVRLKAGEQTLQGDYSLTATTDSESRLRLYYLNLPTIHGYEKLYFANWYGLLKEKIDLEEIPENYHHFAVNPSLEVETQQGKQAINLTSWQFLGPTNYMQYHNISPTENKPEVNDE